MYVIGKRHTVVDDVMLHCSKGLTTFNIFTRHLFGKNPYTGTPAVPMDCPHSAKISFAPNVGLESTTLKLKNGLWSVRTGLYNILSIHNDIDGFYSCIFSKAE